MKKLKYILIPILIGVIFMFGLSKYLDYENMSMLRTKDLYPMLHDAKSEIKDRGVFANNYLVNNNDYILMLGSSELSHSTYQHPDLYFNTGRTKSGIITVGRAYTQSLQDNTIIGSLKNMKGKKVVIILSMQWFMDKEGVTCQHFQTRFSPVQFYDFMTNPKLSEEVKSYYAKRVSKLLKGSSDFNSERLYAMIYNEKNPVIRKIGFVAMKPYFSFRKIMVNLKDKGILYKKLSQQYDRIIKNHDLKGKINWKKEMKNAKIQGKIRVGDKPQKLGKHRLKIDKGYYKAYIKGKDRFFKNRYSYINLTDSQEFYDLENLFKVCKELEIKPTVVLVPGLSGFYDETGLDKNMREKYYDLMRKEVKKYDFRLIDVTENADKPYYLRDVMHIGTTGWVDICNKIYNIYER